MKISGKFILKVAGTLTVISLITAFLLGLVNGVTKDKIAAIDAEKTRVAMSAVVPEGSEFTDALDLTDDVVAAAKAQGGTITELYGVTNGGAEAGYVAKVSASGSQGTITMMVGIDANKAITGISVVSHSETSGTVSYTHLCCLLSEWCVVTSFYQSLQAMSFFALFNLRNLLYLIVSKTAFL